MDLSVQLTAATRIIDSWLTYKVYADRLPGLAIGGLVAGPFFSVQVRGAGRGGWALRPQEVLDVGFGSLACSPLESEPAALASRSSICSFILVSTARTATFTAFLIARGDEFP